MKKPNVVITEIYTIPQTCEILGIDRRTLRRYTASGTITAHIRACDKRIVYYGDDIAKCYYTVI